MTARETERLTRVEERVSNVQERLDKVEGKIDLILEKLEDSDKRFVTRAEIKFTQFLLGLAATAVGLFYLIKDHLR